MIRIMVLSF